VGGRDKDATSSPEYRYFGVADAAIVISDEWVNMGTPTIRCMVDYSSSTHTFRCLL